LPGDGVDILPLLRGDAVEAGPPRFWQWSRYEPTPFANGAGRDGDWKLRYPAVPELFDILADDPIEERRLAADPNRYRPPTRLEQPTHQLGRQAAQLFDLSVDPGERFDVAARHPQRVVRMEGQFAAWYASVEAERLGHRAV
jgi:hypothetical protein